MQEAPPLIVFNVGPQTCTTEWHDVNHWCTSGFMWCDRPSDKKYTQARPSLHHSSKFELISCHEIDQVKWSVAARQWFINHDSFLRRLFVIGEISPAQVFHGVQSEGLFCSTVSVSDRSLKHSAAHITRWMAASSERDSSTRFLLLAIWALKGG